MRKRARNWLAPCHRSPQVVYGFRARSYRASLIQFFQPRRAVACARILPPELSRREQEVLNSLLENLANKEIGDRLHISERTVKFHVSNLLSKFGVRRRADLILLCYQRRNTAA